MSVDELNRYETALRQKVLALDGLTDAEKERAIVDLLAAKMKYDHD